MDLEQRFLEALRRQTSLAPGEAVLIGVSGGRDSVALLHLFHRYQEELGIQVVAGHVNHSLRGEESDGDQAFVEELAGTLSIPCRVRKVDVAAVVRERGGSLEEAARNLRYEALNDLKEGEGCTRIAVAHHRGDQAETVLMHLLRGAGTSGLKGMLPERSGILRPLLDASPEELDGYIQRMDLTYRLDSSNADLRHTRNRIRLELLPLLRTYNPQVEAALARTARIAGEDDAYLEREADARYRELCMEDQGCLEFGEALAVLPPAIRNRVIRKGYARLTGGTLEYRYLEEIGEALEAGLPGRLGLPGNCVLTRYGGKFLLLARTLPDKPFRIEVPAPGVIALDGAELEIRLLKEGEEPGTYKERGADHGWVDAGKVRWPLVVRSRLPGDRFLVVGEAGPRKLGKLLNERGIRWDLREVLPLVEDAGKRIVFIPGIGVGGEGILEENTSEILFFSYRKL